MFVNMRESAWVIFKIKNHILIIIAISCITIRSFNCIPLRFYKLFLIDVETSARVRSIGKPVTWRTNVLSAIRICFNLAMRISLRTNSPV